MQYVDRKRFRAKIVSRVSLMTIGLMLMSTGALALILYSARAPASSEAAYGLPILGVFLAVMAPIVGGLAALNFLVADHILYGKTKLPSDSWKVALEQSGSAETAEASLSHAAQALSHSIATPIVMVLAIVESDFPSQSWFIAFAGGVVCGVCLSGQGGALVRQSHIISSHREIITLQYLAPILALGWLSFLTEINVARYDFLIFGTVSIVAINMLINVDPEAPYDERTAADRRSMQDTAPAGQSIPFRARYSLKALVLCLLGFGMFIYFRDELLSTQQFGWDAGDYWAVLALSATIFALLLAFRLTRVENLLLAEDYRTFGLIRRVEMLPERIFSTMYNSYTKDDLLSHIRKLNQADRLGEYQAAYEKAHRVLSGLVVCRGFV